MYFLPPFQSFYNICQHSIYDFRYQNISIWKHLKFLKTFGSLEPDCEVFEDFTRCVDSSQTVHYHVFLYFGAKWSKRRNFWHFFKVSPTYSTSLYESKKHELGSFEVFWSFFGVYSIPTVPHRLTACLLSNLITYSLFPYLCPC